MLKTGRITRPISRANPVPFDAPIFDPGFLGLHLLDYNFAIDDLMELVARKAAS